MKKALLFIAITILIGSSHHAQGQSVSASIGNGASAGKVNLFIATTSTDFDANKVDNLVFTIRIPISSGNSISVAETFKAAAFSHITFFIAKYPGNDGIYNYYLINGTGTVQIPAGITITTTSFQVLELTLSGMTASGVVELVNLENPGAWTGALIRPQFYIQNNFGDITNPIPMFYGTSGAIPQNNIGVDEDDWVPTASLVTLPVNLLGYSVTCTDKGTSLTWSTASEQNSSKFEIQRSVNSTDWITIDNVAAAGNSDIQRNYQYLDLNSGTAFYRIRQVDNDGRYVYTAVKRTDCKTSQFDITLYPVPAKDNLNVVIKAEKALKTDLQILDINGRILQRINTQINKGNNNIVLNVSGLPAGQYLLSGSDPSVSINKKFTIIR